MFFGYTQADVLWLREHRCLLLVFSAVCVCVFLHIVITGKAKKDS